MSHTLVDLEIALEGSLGRPIACTMMDSEGGGLPLAERYAEAGRNYVSVLPGEHTYRLADFVLVGCREPVPDDPQRDHQADPQRAQEDPRQLVLLRWVGQTHPTRIYTGQFAGFSAGEIPWLHRRRWPYNELRIRDLIHGANMNVNYGYAYAEVPHLMLDLQLVLANLHDWVAHAYFDPRWHQLSLEKAIQMEYRKAGRVTWHSDRIEVMLGLYRYSDQQRAMEATCARFNRGEAGWDQRLVLPI